MIGIGRHSKRTALEREAARRQASPPEPIARTAREAARTCGWCGQVIAVKPRGRIPKWCSAACRQRAWEQSRAAASGRSAVVVVQRRVEVPVERRVLRPRRDEWAPLLEELALQLDTGRLYASDLPALHIAVNAVHAALNRRARPHRY